MILQQGLIAPSSSAWSDMLSRADHDFHHLPSYLELVAQPDEKPCAFVAESGEHGLLFPLLLRPVPTQLGMGEQMLDAISPYGYPGPIVTRGAPIEFVQAALRGFVELLAQKNVVAGFFRLHTILNSPDQFGDLGELVNHGPSVYIDLTHSEEELWAQTRRGHKRDLAALEKRGYTITMDDWGKFDDFLICYYDSMRRLNASEFYFFSKSYFEGLRACLGDDRIHLCLVHLNGEIACAGLVTEMNGLCQYHLSATSDLHFNDHPSKLMLHYLRGWLKNRGNRIYHVGGGVGALRDTLHLFKTGFSPYSADFYTWRIVSSPKRYEELLAAWCAMSGREPIEREAYFPQYRAPLSD